MKIERAKLETVISIKVVKGDGTPENPVRAMRLYFLPNGTFIGEVDESSARGALQNILDDNSFRVGIGGAPVHYNISLNSNSKLSKEDIEQLVDTVAEKLADEIATTLHQSKQS